MWLLHRLKRWWHRRNTPAQELKALNELLVKAGRRVTYDLAHAVSELPADSPSLEIFQDRISHWHGVFNPADFGKNYRNRLMNQISDLESEVHRLEQLCEKHGIDHHHPDKLPF